VNDDKIWQEVQQHEITLGFNCPRCGSPVFKAFIPSQATYAVHCECIHVNYVDDITPDTKHWLAIAKAVRGYK
jgi:hypothetical protein